MSHQLTILESHHGGAPFLRHTQTHSHKLPPPSLSLSLSLPPSLSLSLLFSCVFFVFCFFYIHSLLDCLVWHLEGIWQECQSTCGFAFSSLFALDFSRSCLGWCCLELPARYYMDNCCNCVVIYHFCFLQKWNQRATRAYVEIGIILPDRCPPRRDATP